MKNIFKSLLVMFFAFVAFTAFSNAEVTIKDPVSTSSEVLNETKVTQSAIEANFNGEADGLNQIGYNLFQNMQQQGFGKYDSSYKLNIGEKVNAYFWGDSVDMLSLAGGNLISPLTSAQVDSKGNLFIPGVGLVKAEGRTLQDVETNIQSLSSQKFKNTKVKITVADSTEFAVFVYGYVNKPGKITISNNSSVLEALGAAGGVSKNGSLRNIQYKSGSYTKNVDLYDVILKGKDNGIRLKPNDRIFVNQIGNVIAIKNGVKVPGIYELKNGETLDTALSFAGGFLPSTNIKNLNLKYYNAKLGQRFAKDVYSEMYSKTTLANGDIIQFSDLYGGAENVVSLQGNVKHPQIFQYKAGMKLSDILPSKNELKDETLIHQAVIKRVTGPEKQVKTISVSLIDFFNGGSNPYLAPKDVVTVYRDTNAGFVDVYGCINHPKNMPYGDGLSLKDVLTDIQFITSSSNIQGVNYKKNQISLTELANDKTSAKGTIPIGTTSDNVHIPAYDIAVEITNSDNPSVRTFYLYDVLIKNDTTKSIMINPNDKILFRTLRENENLKTVKVSGYVTYPGVYNFIEGKRLTDMIDVAGGLKKEANIKGIVFKREALASASSQIAKIKNDKDMKQIQGQIAKDSDLKEEELESGKAMMENIAKEDTNRFDGRIVLNIKENDITKISKEENLEIQDGDEIYIPKVANYVTVMGEVYNESSFVYQKGAKAKYYIDLVGGFTPNARRMKIYKIGSDGKAKKLGRLAHAKIEAGDTIVVPRRIRGNDWIDTVMKAMQVIASTLTSVFVVTKI